VSFGGPVVICVVLVMSSNLVALRSDDTYLTRAAPSVQRSIALSPTLTEQSQDVPTLTSLIARTTKHFAMDLPLCPNLLARTSDKKADKPSQSFYESFLQNTAKDIDKYIVKQDEAAVVQCGHCKQYHQCKGSTDRRHGKS